MTTATVAPRAGRHEATQPGSPFTGVPSLLRLALRRDRVRLSVWIAVLTLMMVYAPNAVKLAYPEEAQRLATGEPAQDARRNDAGRSHVWRQRNRPRRDDGQRADAHADHRHVDPVDPHRDSAHPRRGGKRCRGTGAVIGRRQVRPHVCRADPRRRRQRRSGGDDDAGDVRDRLLDRRCRGDVSRDHRSGHGVRRVGRSHRATVASGADRVRSGDGRARDGGAGPRHRGRHQQLRQRSELVLPHRVGPADAAVRRRALVAVRSVGCARDRADGAGRLAGKSAAVRRREHPIRRRAPERAAHHGRVRPAPHAAAGPDHRMGGRIVPGRLGIWLDDQVAAGRGEGQPAACTTADGAGQRRCLHHHDPVPRRRRHRLRRRAPSCGCTPTSNQGWARRCWPVRCRAGDGCSPRWRRRWWVRPC